MTGRELFVALLAVAIGGCSKPGSSASADAGATVNAGTSAGAGGSASAGTAVEAGGRASAGTAVASPAVGGREGDCEVVVGGVVAGLPAVKARLAGVEAELKKHPRRRMGGVGPERESDGTVSGSLGVHSDERYEAIVFYKVSPAGTLEVNAPDPIAVPAADAAKVAAACKAR